MNKIKGNEWTRETPAPYVSKDLLWDFFPVP